jgi:hypothetical protein
MLSRAERLRRVGEHALRVIAVAATATLLWRAMRPPVATGADVARGDLRAAMVRWTLAPATAMRVVFDAAPDPDTRDWLRALARAGGSVGWSASRPIAAAAVVAEPAVEPNGVTRVRLASASGEAVSVADDAGVIDTLPHGGARELEVGTVAGAVRASGATFTATSYARDSVVLRPVLVLGAAGWESKFTIAALEERGWRVASRVRVAPSIDVTQGPLGAIDTVRYAAVIVLDSTGASSSTEIARYARAGGGVILAGSASRTGAFAGIAPGRVGARVGGVAGAISTATPRTGLGGYPVTAPGADAVVLESRDGATMIAARRLAAGRVMQVGYDETWRWRMAGGDESAAAHREWWSRLVAAVAYAPLVPRDSRLMTIDETPLASLVDAVGPATPVEGRLAAHTDNTWITWMLFVLIAASLLAEWTSRRLRGAR